jgi:predicted ArsR family transcriptional regulator
MTNDNALQMSPEDHQAAFTEVAFLIESFANTIDNIMGGATAPVGRIAGRAMARKMPLHLTDPSLESVLELLAQRMQAGFEMTTTPAADGSVEVAFGHCALREVCSLRKMETGSAVCKLFHSYFDGIVNELLHRPVKSEIIATGPTCTIKTRSQ